jgi:Transposase, Mutator family
MLKAALERGLEVELTDHVGYERGDPDALLFPNSRNGATAKTVAGEIGDVELASPRDRNGTFAPQLIPKGSRRLGGLNEMIISLYAGGMTLCDIQHHLVSTIGTELSHETISRSPTRSARRSWAGSGDPWRAWRFLANVANPEVKGFGCPGTRTTRCRRRSSAATSS